ncbi:MAG: type II secretion system protein N [Rubrivivax sp.]
MTARWVAFLTWAAVAAGAVYWALKLAASPSALPAHAQVAAAGARLSGDLSRVLGAGAPVAPAPVEPVAATPAPDSRFSLLGVVAPRPGTSAREGLALIAVDDQPAKAYRVGSTVEGALMLLTVSARGASLGPRGGPPSVVLELPELPAPASGPAPGSEGVPPAAPLPPGAAGRVAIPGRPPGMQPAAAQGGPPRAQPGRPNLPMPQGVPGLPAPTQGEAGTPVPRTP